MKRIQYKSTTNEIATQIFTKMKHLFLWLCFLIAFTETLVAQDVIRKNAVPPAVVEEFEYRFSAAENVIWLKEGEQFYGARFQVNGQDAEAIYNPNGDWVQTEQEIPYQEMPDSARNYCRSNYPDYQAKAVKKVSTRKYGILYEIRVLGAAKQIGMTFDMHGKLVKEKEIAAVEEEQTAKVGVKEKLGNIFKKGE